MEVVSAAGEPTAGGDAGSAAATRGAGAGGDDRGDSATEAVERGGGEGDDADAVPVAVAPCGEAPPGMACIPGGPFLRGADDGDADEKPARQVIVSTFYVDVHEVTNEEFERCIEAAACRRPMPYRDFRAPRQPVVAVDWYNAAAYCEWAGKRLPTEAEWEKAARGEDGRTYPWGNDAPACDRAAYRGCPPDRTRTVGSFEAGPWGLFDMAGNSYEWVADWYASCYEGCEGECGEDCAGPDPRGPCDGAIECPERKFKVLRGGSWYWSEHEMRASDRRPMRPDSGVRRLGFRCAMDVPPAAAAGGEAPE